MSIGSPAQGAELGLDILSRYVCNTFDEALANSDPDYRRTKFPQLASRGDMRPFDFIVVGGGTFGAAVAEHLWFRATGRSERILVLEAGPLLLSGHSQNFPSLGLGREIWGVPWRDPGNLGYGGSGLAYCVGGRSLFWGGWSPRLLGTETGTWPIAVMADLNAATLANGDDGYFRQAGRQIGVTETNDYIFGDLHRAIRRRLYDALTTPVVPRGPITDAMPLAAQPPAPPVEILPAAPVPPTLATLSELAALLGEQLPVPLPAGPAIAALADEYRNRLKLEAPLAVQARPQHAGFFPMNKFSTAPLLIKAARTAYSEAPGDDVRKRLMVVPRCHVTRLSVVADANGQRRVNAVQTEHGPVPVSPDCKVIIALGTVESTRLALLSFGPDGRMGTNLMAHLRSNIGLRIPRASLEPPVMTQALQTSALFLKGLHTFGDGSLGHFHLQITASGLDNISTNAEAELFQAVPDVEFLNQHLHATDSHIVITIRAIGEMQSRNANSNVTLDQNPAMIDFGERRAFVNLQTTAKDDELWNAMDRTSEDVAAAFANGQKSTL
ncbi:GMC family oxidoreductase [Dankookia rubra]|uniref:GMC family oxidoreductase n=1 Tax=Dankookia rubra TaxID=1442381 RepID=UPI0019D5648F|nr:GMC family oxidoreductase [Dankookia rubra]